jgi:hypothetical protein
MSGRVCGYGAGGVVVGTTVVAVSVTDSSVPVGIGLLLFICTEITFDAVERSPAPARA